MSTKSEYLIDKIFKKLKKNKKRKINLEKDELEDFLLFLIKNG